MNDKKNKIDILDQYLANRLSAVDKKRFEEELEQNPDFRLGFERHKIIIDGIKLQGRKALKDDMKEWEEELKKSESTHAGMRQIQPYRWYYAAAAIVLLVASIAVIYSNLDTGYEKIVAMHYQPYVYIPDIQRGEGAASDPIDEIFRYYDQGNYSETISLINKIEESERSDLLNFLQANAYQAEAEFQQAIPIFEKIVDSESIYSMGANWYLALCYLSENQPDKAVSILERLKKSNSSFAPKSEKLLKELN